MAITLKPETERFAADEFIRRFMQHALPPGFRRVRHYGRFARMLLNDGALGGKR